MDPKTLVEKLRILAARQLDNVNEGHADWDDMLQFAEGFQELDEWLSKGGFLPQAWQGAGMTSFRES